MVIAAGGMYTGNVIGGGEGGYSYDPSTAMITFTSGAFFSASGVVNSLHLVGRYPSATLGDAQGTITLAELPGYSNDSGTRPATLGSASGLWHCTPVVVSNSPSAPASTPASVTSSATSAGLNLSVPFGVYGESGHTQQMVIASDGSYAIGPLGDPRSGQAGTYEVKDSSSIYFLTGPYAGLIGGLYPNYHGSTRSYIDVSYQGTTTSWEYYHA